MTSGEIPQYKRTGFDSERYLALQREKILERIDHFREGKLYLEIGGAFLYDPHGARVLPGFDPTVKKQIFKSLRSIIDIFFCIKSQDVTDSRHIHNTGLGYKESIESLLKKIEEELQVKPKIVINLCDRPTTNEQLLQYEEELKSRGYEVYKRYKIAGYPDDTNLILSESGFGADDYIPSTKKLIIVAGPVSNSGKMSTCLGQIYLDHLRNLESGYAKYELFPIWSLPIGHPVNLAYEAATADIGDFNLEDPYHLEAYGKRSVNYNRDIEAFKIIRNLAERFITERNFMKTYKSPTDMGINYSGFAITDDEAVCVASLNEIVNRKSWYQEMVIGGNGSQEWVMRCEQLIGRAESYIREKGYNPMLDLTQ